MGDLPQLHASERGVLDRIEAELTGLDTGGLSAIMYAGGTPTAEQLGYEDSSVMVIERREGVEFHSGEQCIITDYSWTMGDLS